MRVALRYPAVLATTVAFGLARALGAQNSPTHEVSVQRAWLTRGDATVLAAFAVAAAAATPMDVHLAREFQRPSVHRSSGLSHTASVVRAAGDPGALLFSVGLFATGRWSKRRALADAGLHATEAVLVSGFATGVLKGIVGRARPYTVLDSSASVLRPFRRGGGYTSFPSGHTTVAFAAASALSRELAQSDFMRAHRTLAPFATPVLFSAASAVGLSRMYHDAHWASDVIAGAGIGTLSGRIFVRAQHDGAPDRVDRWLLPASITPSANGAALTWHFEF